MKRFTAILILLAAVAVSAMPDASPKDNSEFIFARVEPTQREYRMYWSEAPWHHDYPDGDTMLPDSLGRLTSAHTTANSYQIVDIDNPDLFKYPFAYLCEPGYLNLNDKDAKNHGERNRRNQSNA